MYETVFVISSKPDMWFVVSLAVGLMAFSWVCVEYGRYRKGKDSIGILKGPTIIPTVICSMSCITAIILNVTYMASSYKSNSAYKKGEFAIAEGKVIVLREQPKDGRGEGDIIKIDDTKLFVDPHSFFTNAKAYKKTIAFGGVLKNGVYVRVYHYDGKILRIDIRKNKREN